MPPLLQVASGGAGRRRVRRLRPRWRRRHRPHHRRRRVRRRRVDDKPLLHPGGDAGVVDSLSARSTPRPRRRGCYLTRPRGPARGHPRLSTSSTPAATTAAPSSAMAAASAVPAALPPPAGRHELRRRRNELRRGPGSRRVEIVEIRTSLHAVAAGRGENSDHPAATETDLRASPDDPSPSARCARRSSGLARAIRASPHTIQQPERRVNTLSHHARPAPSRPSGAARTRNLPPNPPIRPPPGSGPAFRPTHHAAGNHAHAQNSNRKMIATLTNATATSTLNESTRNVSMALDYPSPCALVALDAGPAGRLR